MERTRDGNRRQRKTFPKRVPKLGYYFIATDTEETEKNYLCGLRDSLPKELQDHIVIKVKQARTEELIETCQLADVDPQYRQCWIVLDRDQVPRFDEIIAEAKSKDIHVGWSNPCIEIWFDAYFGEMPTAQDSVHCCKDFAQRFRKKTGREYKKSDEKIYEILKQCGDEEKAIQLAEKRLEQYMKDGVTQYSKMCPCTTLHHLIDEIRTKTNLT